MSCYHDPYGTCNFCRDREESRRRARDYANAAIEAEKMRVAEERNKRLCEEARTKMAGRLPVVRDDFVAAVEPISPSQRGGRIEGYTGDLDRLRRDVENGRLAGRVAYINIPD